MKLSFATGGSCAERIDMEIEDGRIVSTGFVGGKPGNPLVLEVLSKGKDVAEAIALLRGLACNGDSSCPGRLARALEEAIGK